jgi:membrane associated rhomboid family serine protease
MTQRPNPMRISGSSDWPPPISNWRWWSVTYWLIAINIAVYVVDLLLKGTLTDYGAFTADSGISHLQFWRWISYEFLHASPMHLIVNMVALISFGPPVEAEMRRGQFIVFYLLSGLGGVLGYLILWRMRFLDVQADTMLVGSSACIFGLIMAAVKLAPNREIVLVWPPVRLRLVTLGLILVGVAVLVVVTKVGGNAGGEAAHLGGGAVGFVLIRHTHWFSKIGITKKRRRFWQPGDPASNFFREE